MIPDSMRGFVTSITQITCFQNSTVFYFNNTSAYSTKTLFSVKDVMNVKSIKGKGNRTGLSQLHGLAQNVTDVKNRPIRTVWACTKIFVSAKSEGLKKYLIYCIFSS